MPRELKSDDGKVVTRIHNHDSGVHVIAITIEEKYKVVVDRQPSGTVYVTINEGDGNPRQLVLGEE